MRPFSRKVGDKLIMKMVVTHSQVAILFLEKPRCLRIISESAPPQLYFRACLKRCDATLKDYNVISHNYRKVKIVP